MRTGIWLGIGLTTLLALPSVAQAQRTTGITARVGWNAADPAQRQRIRLNRGLFNLVGQQPNVAGVCGSSGARSLRARSNGWDALFSVVTAGLYTPQHAYVVCNGSTIG
jgi:hypothetical protein